MGKFLITGASGFIGSFIVAEALEQGHEVVAAIRKTSSRAYLQDDRIQFLELNLRDRSAIEEAIKDQGFTAVIHNAGATAVSKRADYFAVNTELTKNLAEAYENQYGAGRFVFMSSLAALGPAQQQPSGILDLDSQPFPVTAYGQSKLEADDFLQSKTGLNYVSLRPTAVFGPRERDILDFFKMVNRGFEPYVGRAPQALSFIYVKDLARLVVNAAATTRGGRTAYPVSDGAVYSADDLGAFAKAALNKKTVKVKIPLNLVRLVATVVEKSGAALGKYPTFNREKVNELGATSWKVDTAPLVEQFNFEPTYTLETGIHETIKWYRQHNWL